MERRHRKGGRHRPGAPEAAARALPPRSEFVPLAAPASPSVEEKPRGGEAAIALRSSGVSSTGADLGLVPLPSSPAMPKAVDEGSTTGRSPDFEEGKRRPLDPAEAGSLLNKVALAFNNPYSTIKDDINHQSLPEGMTVFPVADSTAKAAAEVHYIVPGPLSRRKRKTVIREVLGPHARVKPRWGKTKGSSLDRLSSQQYFYSAKGEVSRTGEVVLFVAKNKKR